MRIKLYRSDQRQYWLECTEDEAENLIHPLLTK